MMYPRKIPLTSKPKESFFLWGPRQVGKTKILKTLYPNAFWIQLLHNDEFLEYSQNPELLRERVKAEKPGIVVIDEVQKVPALLDEVHALIEETSTVFVLCGSSARKLIRGHANLLGGRALRFELLGLSAIELGKDFSLTKSLNNGYLPAIYSHSDPQKKLQAYCGDYLKEEIFNEGLLRKLPPFSRFLELAALSDTEQIAYESFARDVGVSAPTIASYYEVLKDTLIGSFLPAYTLKPKRQIKRSPKFYFSDVGVVNYLSRRGRMEPRSELWGKAFENWVHHELRCYLAYCESHHKLSYWALGSNAAEVDFIVGDMLVAIEAKSSSKITSEHLKGLKELQKDYPKVGNRYVICGEKSKRVTEDGIQILDSASFIKLLWSGKIF